MASQVIFDDENPNDEVPQGAGDEFEEAKPLAEELIDTLIDLLFFADFTLPRSPTSKSKVTYAIWQSGVGCNTAIGTSKEFESNRCEILRLLLTLTSKVRIEQEFVMDTKYLYADTVCSLCIPPPVFYQCKV